jgi:hypothetical protein
MAALATSIVAVAGLAISATTTGIAMGQKSKARKNQMKAEAAAAKSMREARSRLDVNYQEGSSISKDPYTMAIDASLSQGADAVQASRETQRGAAQVGRIQGAQNQMMEGQRVAQGQELQEREQRIIDEDSRLRDVNTQLDLEEVAGAQQAAANFEDQANQASQDIVAGVGATIQSGMDMVPLYQQNLSAQRAAISDITFDKNQAAKFGTAAGFNSTPGELQSRNGVLDFGSFGGGNFSSVGDMRNSDFRKFKRNLSPSQKRQIQLNPQYQQALFPQ